MSRAWAVAAAATLAVAGIAPASAERPLPSWSRYQAERAVQLGWRALEIGDLARAETLAVRATALEPEHVEAWRLHTMTLARAGRWEEASSAALELTGLADDDVDAALLAGRISLEIGVRASAAAWFERAGRLRVGDARAELGLAMIAARMDQDWEAFTRHLRAALQEDPSIDLSTLPLQDGWAAVAEDEAFLAGLTEVLQAR
jgi:Flp pilus assembly protein TadD